MEEYYAWLELQVVTDEEKQENKHFRKEKAAFLARK